MFFMNKNQKGDTIVEVMIVLAVLGLALSIAYATANRSLLNARQAQENSEASSLLQSQAEGLRVLAGSEPRVINGDEFCINTSTITYAVASDAVCTAVNDVYNLEVSIRYCLMNTTDDECQTADMKTEGTYLIRATWDNVRGEGKDSVKYTYRYYGPWNAP